MKTAFAALVLSLLALAASAVEPGEILDDPRLEERAREVSKGLRCLVCQNQSIDESDAELARDLRLLVRQRLTAGDSNQQVIDYVVSRYGDFVLLMPPLKGATYVLWFGPLVIAGLGILAVILFFRRRQRTSPAAPPPLSADEKRRLREFLDGDAE